MSRPGWWRPLYSFTESSAPLTRAELRQPENDSWIRAWVTDMRSVHRSAIAAPVQLYPGGLRANQGYLTKMPRAFVERWRQLSRLADELDDAAAAVQEGDSPSATLPPTRDGFKGKSGTPYEAMIKGGVQHRTRNHERLLTNVAGWLSEHRPDAVVSNRHPLDMLISGRGWELIVEAKTIGNRHAGFAVRQAVGQLHEYRHSVGPQSANLAILLDGEPPADVAEYVRTVLNLGLLWWDEGQLWGDVEQVLPREQAAEQRHSLG